LSYRIGGDSGLSIHGINYAKNLAEFVEDNISLSCKDSNGKFGPFSLIYIYMYASIHLKYMYRCIHIYTNIICMYAYTSIQVHV
jgi:hypothetical protein